MNNSTILQLLEAQRDNMFHKLKESTISGLYREQYELLRDGKMVLLGADQNACLREWQQLSEDRSRDQQLQEKLSEYEALDNNALVAYFQKEWERILHEISKSGKADEIQAVFLEYDFYYHYSSIVLCYGKQEYPIIEIPRYISDEYDYRKHVLYLDNGINFQPAWVSCEEFEDMDTLDVENSLQELFVLHSRVLLHMALEACNRSGALALFRNRPFHFYVNEHDCEVMMLYRL